MKRNYEDLILYALKVVQEAEANQEQNPTSDLIQVVIVEPSKKPYAKTIKNELAAMNQIVGGFIEHVVIGKTETGANVAAVVNEEGKLYKLPYNRKILSTGGFADILVGTFFITAVNLAGDNVSLSDAQAERYIKRFTPREVYI